MTKEHTGEEYLGKDRDELRAVIIERDIEIARLQTQIEILQRANRFLSEQIASAHEPSEGRFLQLNEEDCRRLDLDITWEGAYKRISVPEKSGARPPCIFRQGCKYQPICSDLCHGTI